MNASYGEQHAIGKRYRRHDEAGTPFCVTVDGETLNDAAVRDRVQWPKSVSRLIS